MAESASKYEVPPRFAAFRGRGIGRSPGNSSHSQSHQESTQDGAERPKSPYERKPSPSENQSSSQTSGWSGGQADNSRRDHSPATNGDSGAERPAFAGRTGSNFGGRGTGGMMGRSSGEREDGSSHGDRNEGGRGGGYGGRGGSFGGRGGSSEGRGGGFGGRRGSSEGRGGGSEGRGGGFSGRGGSSDARGGGVGRGGGFSSRDSQHKDRRGDGEESHDDQQREFGRGDHGDRRDRGGPREGGLDDSRPPPYVPPPPPSTEEELFKHFSTGLNFSKYDDIPVRLTGRDPVSPISSFDDAQLNGTISENVRKGGYKKPTPVQKHAIPAVMAGRDLMACAQTGSGKTAAFLLPVMSRMMADGIDASKFAEIQSPAAIVVAPTRELVTQIWIEAIKFSYSTMLRPVVLYGGTSLGKQLREVEEGCHLIIATPGRLLDVINRRKIDLGAVKYLILDEADRMLDMGFLPTIQKLVEQLGMASGRQTLMFSATFPNEVQGLAKNFLDDYLFLTVGILGGAASDVKQDVVQVEEYGKRKKLIEILSAQGSDRSIVFVETKRTADFLASYLCQQQFPCTSIHGDRQQKEREEALRDFKNGEKPVLVATSVASRGLDIPDVKHIINFDMPSEIEDYVHRVGRTGRIGHSGLATSFFTVGKDEGLARSLVKILSDATQEVPDWLESAASGAIGSHIQGGSSGFGGQDMREHGGRRGGRGGSRGCGGGGFGGRGGFDGNQSESGGGDSDKAPWKVGKSLGGGGAAQQADEESWD